MLERGTMLDRRYEILEHIGSGGMADVYKAIDHNLNRFVAVKLLRQEFNDDENFVKKFLAEARSTAVLSHPNIVNIYDSGEDDGLHFIIMELASGMTLKQYIRRYGRLSVRETVDFSLQIASAIQAAHEHNIIHRDIKPQNILVSDSGKVKVTDFGIARIASGETKSAETMGSVHYISPEQARGGYTDKRTDIYSLGITMYEMATGRVPFEGENSVSIAIMHLQSEIVPPRKLFPDIPVSLENIILKCTQKQPELRYQSAAELIADLDRVFTSPDGDYVYIEKMIDDSPTDIWTKDEINQKLKEKRAEGPDKNHTSKRPNPVIEEEEEHPEEDATSTKMQRLIRGIIAVLVVLIVAVVIYLMINASKLFHFGESTTTEEQVETTTEASFVIMPDLKGKTKDEAAQALNNIGLQAEFVYEKGTDENTDELIVKKQQYGVGSNVVSGSRVEVTLGKSKSAESTTIAQRIEVPTLVNMKASDAEKLLKEKGLAVRKAYKTSDTVKEDYIIKQNPKGGTTVNHGFVVTVTISLGVSKVEVPSLSGMSQGDAEHELERVGLKLGDVNSGYSGDVGVGDVFKQSVAPGTMVKKGSEVGVTVSIGEEDTFSYQGEVTIDQSPFSGDESGSVRLELEQGDYKKTFFNETGLTKEDFPMTQDFDGKKEGDAVVHMYVNGDLYQSFDVKVQAIVD